MNSPRVITLFGVPFYEVDPQPAPWCPCSVTCGNEGGADSLGVASHCGACHDAGCSTGGRCKA